MTVSSILQWTPVPQTAVRRHFSLFKDLVLRSGEWTEMERGGALFVSPDTGGHFRNQFLPDVYGAGDHHVSTSNLGGISTRVDRQRRRQKVRKSLEKPTKSLLATSLAKSKGDKVA